jgi:hypothetical protein
MAGDLLAVGRSLSDGLINIEPMALYYCFFHKKPLNDWKQFGEAIHFIVECNLVSYIHIETLHLLLLQEHLTLASSPITTTRKLWEGLPLRIFIIISLEYCVVMDGKDTFS